MKINSNTWLLITALVLRFILAAFFYHPDLKSQNFHAQFLSQGILNIYDFLGTHRQSLPYSDTYNYPPLIYFIQGSWQSLAKIVTGPGLSFWLNDWGGQANFHPGMFGYLLILKLPYFLADLLTLGFLLRLVSAAAEKRRLAIIWLFNPISLYAIYMIGQFDIYPSLLTVIALYLSTHKRFLWAGLAIGIGAALKTYPLFLFPFIAIYSRSIKNIALLTVGSLLGWGIPLFPFISSSEFVRTVFHSQFTASVRLPYFFALYGLIFLVSYFSRPRFSLTSQFLAVSLSLLLFTDFHPQWLIWCTPFLCLLLAKYTRLFPLIAGLILAAFLTILLIPDQYVLLGMFVPLNPYLGTVPAVSTFIPQSELLRSLFQVLFAAFGLLIIYKSYVFDQKNI